MGCSSHGLTQSRQAVAPKAESQRQHYSPRAASSGTQGREQKDTRRADVASLRLAGRGTPRHTAWHEAKPWHPRQGRRHEGSTTRPKRRVVAPKAGDGKTPDARTSLRSGPRVGAPQDTRLGTKPSRGTQGRGGKAGEKALEAASQRLHYSPKAASSGTQGREQKDTRRADVASLRLAGRGTRHVGSESRPTRRRARIGSGDRHGPYYLECH